ncbi:MAG: hypothetical protein AAB425_04425, partial [Bdellovibrionota bacterium]
MIPHLAVQIGVLILGLTGTPALADVRYTPSPGGRQFGLDFVSGIPLLEKIRGLLRRGVKI